MLKTYQRPVAAALVVLGVCCSSFASIKASQDVPVLTLAEAVRESLVHNDRMVDQQDNVEQARLAVRVARNEFRPKLVPNILGSFGQTNVSDQSYRLDFSQRFVTGTTLRVGAGASTAQIPSSDGRGDLRFYNADTTLTISQPLLRGLGPRVARRALTTAELREADAGRERVRAEQQVAVEVASAYYRVVAQKALAEVAMKSLDRSHNLKRASDAKLEAGLVSQLDVFRAQQLVYQAETQLSDAEGAVENARDDLRFLMGRDSDVPFNVVSEIPKVVDPIGADEAVAMALARRLDLQGAIAAAADADRGTSFARNQLLPQVDVNLALTRRQTADSFPASFGFRGFQFATFFTIAMPVDRTVQLADYQTAIMARDRRRREIETLRKRIADDVRRALRERDRVLRSLTAAEANVLLSEREVEVAQLRYERGLSNNLDVVTAESNLLNAHARRIFALAELAVARLSLRGLLGILDARADMGVASTADQRGPGVL